MRSEALPMRRLSPDLWQSLLVFFGAFAIYFFTSARSPGWVDATLLLAGVRHLELNAWVNTHNLYNLLGHGLLAAVPFLDPHRALTLFSVALGSLTVLLLFLTAREVTGSRPAAALTSVAMVLSHSLWWHSTTIEVYALNALLIALILLLVFQFAQRGGFWRLALAFFAAGLGVSNHVLMGLYVFAFVILLLLWILQGRLKASEVLMLLGCAVAGAALFLFVFIRDVVSAVAAAGRTRSLPATILHASGQVLRQATGGGFQAMMFPRGIPGSQRLFWRLNYGFLLLWNFPSAAIVFIALGFPRLWRSVTNRTAVVFFLVGLAAQLVWSANYLIWDMYAFALPVYVMLAVPLACGIDGFLSRYGSRPRRWPVLLTFAIPVLLYPTFHHWPARQSTVDWYIRQYPESVRLCGFWDPAEYIFSPIKCHYRAVESFAEAWAARLPPGSHYWDDESKAAYPLKFYYQEVRGLRTDVQIHTVFGLLLTQYQAEEHAREIQHYLQQGDPVFISSLVEPEREVLNQLYRLEDPSATLVAIRSLSVEQLCRTFPRTRILEFPLTADRAIRVYRLEQ